MESAPILQTLPRTARFLGRIGACIVAFASIAPQAASPITALHFSPDGRELWVGQARRLVALQPPSLAQRLDVALPLKKITALALDPSGRWVGVAGGIPGESGEVHVRETHTGAPRSTLAFPDDWVTATSVSHDGTELALGHGTGRISLHRISSEGHAAPAHREWTGHSGPVLSLRHAGEGHLFSASADRSIKVWSVANGRLERSLGHHTDRVHALAVRPRRPGGAEENPPAVICASASDDQTVRVWQPGIGRMIRIVRQHPRGVLALAWLADGTGLISAGQDGHLRWIDAESDQIQHTWKGSTDWVYTLAAHPSRAEIASGDAAGEVTLWRCTAEGPMLLSQRSP
jgi:WD40 repeat protein